MRKMIHRRKRLEGVAVGEERDALAVDGEGVVRGEEAEEEEEVVEEGTISAEHRLPHAALPPRSVTSFCMVKSFFRFLY